METNIFIEENNFNRTCTLWVTKENNKGDRFNVHFDNETKELISTPIENSCAVNVNENLKPFFITHTDLFREIAKEIGRYNNKHSILTEKEDTQKGKLIATEKHLEDLVETKNQMFELMKTFITQK